MYFYTYENLSCFMLCINIGAQRKLEKILKDKMQRVNVEKNIWISSKKVFQIMQKNCGEETSNASNDATEATTSVTTSAASAITRFINSYIYGFGAVPVVVTGACVYSGCNKRSSQVSNKEQFKEQQQPIN